MTGTAPEKTAASKRRPRKTRSVGSPDRPLLPQIREDVASLVQKQAVVGWREWIRLPDLGIQRIQAKIDTGARTSALHAVDIEPFDVEGDSWVRFVVNAAAADTDDPAHTICVAPVRDQREIRSSNGETETRYVIGTCVVLGGRRFNVEVTLTDRSQMEYEMLFGRTALRTGRFLVHPSREFLASSQLAPEPPPAAEPRKETLE